MLSLNAPITSMKRRPTTSDAIAKLPKRDPNADPRTRNYAGNLIEKFPETLANKATQIFEAKRKQSNVNTLQCKPEE